MDLEYHEPASVREALRLLNQLAGDALLIAGGTDLMVAMRGDKISARHLVSLRRVPGLDGVRIGETGELILGPMVTHRSLEESDLVKKRWPLLAEAAATIGCRSVRNVGTIGGNICNASPAADTAPALMVLDARVTASSLRGNRDIPITRFFKGPGKTALEPDEMVTAIVIPPTPPGWGDCYLKLGRRNAMEISTVSVAVGLALEAAGSLCGAFRLALGAVGPVPFRVPEAERLLKDKALDPDADGPLQAAAEAASRASRPITDLRASADYRRDMVAVLTRRAATRAVERSKGWKR